MNLIKQTGPHCLVTSAAMVLATTPEKLHLEIGTDGTEIWWPPNDMRGIHIQEVQDCCIRRGFCLYPIELHMYLCPSTGVEPKPCGTNHLRRFMTSILGRRGILITHNHAVAWDGKLVYDPKGFIKSFEDYDIIEAWLLGKI